MVEYHQGLIGLEGNAASSCKKDSGYEGNNNHSNISDDDPCLLFNVFIRLDLNFRKIGNLGLEIKSMSFLHRPIM